MASVMQSILQKIYEATHSPAVQAGGVPPLASPDAAVLAPNTPGSAPPPAPPMAAQPAQAPGIMSTVGSIFAPQAGSFWASALKHGLAGANQGLIDDPLAHAAQVAKLQNDQGVAAQNVAKGQEDATHIRILPTGGVVQMGVGANPGITNLQSPQAAPTPQERNYAAWLAQNPNATDAQKTEAFDRITLGRVAPEVLKEQIQGAIDKVIQNNKTKKFAPRAGSAKAGAPPAGFQ